MVNFVEIIQKQLKPYRDRFDKLDPAARKKWLAYGGLLIVSFVLFIALGGSRPRPAMNIPGGDTEALVANTFQEIDERLVGMGELDQQGIDWDRMPEGLDPVYETWGRDPFASRYREGVSDIGIHDSDLSLSAISWKGTEAFVLINDSILEEGDRVDGAEVVKIFTDSVVLLKNGRQIVLNMSGGS